MKKKLFLAVTFLALAACLFVACKKEDDSAIAPGYSQDKGTGGNPNASSTGTTTTASTT
ncbi:MAG: hypothetical protein Q8M29_03350 [Bacteroidota bacterium]|nr:hypothetical protein [Bacteroidota bacterium]